MSETVFDDLALGARFRYKGSEKTYVKLSRGGTIAEWDSSQSSDRWVGQAVLSFKDRDPRIELVEDTGKGPDPDFADEELLRRAVSHLGVIARRRQPRWAVAMDLFVTGSASASKLCLRFGFDPDSEIGPSEWELVQRVVCLEDEELTVERWDEIFPGVDPPPEHERR